VVCILSLIGTPPEMALNWKVCLQVQAGIHAHQLYK
jgi:hypothetical protein